MSPDQTLGFQHYCLGSATDSESPHNLCWRQIIVVSFVGHVPKTHKTPRKLIKRSLLVEQLEDRSVPTTFSVVNLHSGGGGSLRQAIQDANAHPGSDLIEFNVAGTIRLTTAALPTVTGRLDLDGTTAPGFAGTPVVELNFNHFGGLRFGPAAAGSDLRSLGLVNAAGAGVTISGGGGMLVVGNFSGLELTDSSANTVGGPAAQDRNVISGNRRSGIRLSGSSDNRIVGNYIGTDVTGTVDRGNAGNGIGITAGAARNTVGGSAGNVISGNDANGVFVTGGAKATVVVANLIGLTASGKAALGNRLDGVRVENASGNLIGQSDPVTGVTYATTGSVPMQPVSGWQGIRNSDTAGQYLIAGTSGPNGLLFDGTMAGVGTSYSVNYPGAADTSVYGPDNLGNGTVRLVGSYRNADFVTAPVEVNGFLFEGTVADLSQAGSYRTVDYPGAKYNYVHSTMGGLAVGNYDSPVAHGQFNLPLGPGHAYVFDVATDTFLTDVAYPGSKSNTAYGIWSNGGTSYTICGGYSLDPAENLADQSKPIGQAYLVDYDSATGKFTNWATFAYPHGTNFVTHFEGISSVEKGVYTLSADSVQAGTTDPVQGSWVSVRRNTDGSFGKATWVDLNYAGVDPTTNVTSSNAVYGDQVVGIVIGANPFSYQATVNLGFQLSNVISGNGGNGVDLYGANDNRVAMNHIGTDATGTVDLGNGRNGILISAGARRNIIGGEATGGNDPTNGVYVRPPQGNLVSGNEANGVLVTGLATENTLSGNFIGTTGSGTAALGNALDGVAVRNASGNALVGCALRTDPFVFYNVISGNGASGLSVTDSNNTTIQGNFLGLGADNRTAVGNRLDGLVVGGSSANTVVGGPIPLGNVIAANAENGILVQGTASKFISYNTFCGLAAFQTYPDLGNRWDGMKVTSTGGNILLRTNVVTENGNDGIEISGAARGVRVAGNIIGLDTNGNAAMGNKNNGVEVDGTAHDVVVGGPQETFNIIPHNAISANGGNGVAIGGAAHDVQVSFSFVGTDLVGTGAFGNARAGVFVGPGTRSISIGSTDPTLFSVISGNLGNGVELRDTRGDTVVGCLIGTDVLGLAPLPNRGDGVHISESSNNVIGRPGPYVEGAAGGPANLIAFNAGNGVTISSGMGNAIRGNSIYGNVRLGIDLAAAANAGPATPVLNSVSQLPFGVQVSGTLTAKPNTVYTIEYFANDTRAPSGRYSLGSQTVRTQASGVATFHYDGPNPPDGARFITATATDAKGNTSEFSVATV
jgi:parallel beta-helix repeat protein